MDAHNATHLPQPTTLAREFTALRAAGMAPAKAVRYARIRVRGDQRCREVVRMSGGSPTAAAMLEAVEALASAHSNPVATRQAATELLSQSETGELSDAVSRDLARRAALLLAALQAIAN